jgi:hypothetical protein
MIGAIFKNPGTRQAAQLAVCMSRHQNDGQEMAQAKA